MLRQRTTDPLLWFVVIGVNLRQILHPDDAHGSAHAIFLVLALFIYAIGYLGIRQKRIFTESDHLSPAAKTQPARSVHQANFRI